MASPPPPHLNGNGSVDGSGTASLQTSAPPQPPTPTPTPATLTTSSSVSAPSINGSRAVPKDAYVATTDAAAIDTHPTTLPTPPTSLALPKSASSLAEVLVSQPYRFARADVQLAQLGAQALKDIFDAALQAEGAALPEFTSLLNDTFPPQHLDASRPTAASVTRSGKRKRGNADSTAAAAAAAGSGTPSSQHHPLFTPTPLSELVVEGMQPQQVWEQMELRGEKLATLLDRIAPGNDVQNDDDDEEEEDEVGEDADADAEDDEDEDEDEEEDDDDEDGGRGGRGQHLPGRKIVHSLRELSDADLRALGVDPALREELQALEDDGADDDDDDEEDDDDEDDDGEGYAGASDLSDEEERRAVRYEPLQSEEEQLRRKREAEARERRRLRSQRRVARSLGLQMDGGDDEDEDEDEDEEGDEEYDGEEEEDEEDEGDEEEDDAAREAYLAKLDPELRAIVQAQEGKADGDVDDDEADEEEGEEADHAPPPKKRKGGAKGLLESLDEPGRPANSSNRRHPTLDDGFFSIDQFNAATAQADEEQDADDEGLEGIDLFQDPGTLAADGSSDSAPGPSKGRRGAARAKGEGERAEEDEDEEPQQEALFYADFFAPPRGAAARKAAKKAAAASKDSTSPPRGEKATGGSERTKRGSKATPASATLPERSEGEERRGQPPPPPSSGSERAGSRRGVRFHDEVKVRYIKSRRGRDDDDDDDDATAITPELLAALRRGSGPSDEAADEEDGVEEEDDDEDEDEDEDEEGTDDDERGGQEDDEEEEDEGDEDMDVDDDDEAAGDEEDGETLAAARRVAGDLFADTDADAVDGAQAKSTHERRVAALQDEIARLERENVGDKEWTLMGEASAKSRPQNSLLEEDLEYEFGAKVKPVVTEASTRSLEETIKRRILESRFDDVERRLAVEATPFLPSRLLELSDAKSAKSLAQIYEEEYEASRRREAHDGGENGAAPLAESDAKLEREHEEIKSLLDDALAKLDSLSNAHFTPKAPKAAVRTLTNVAAITIESALPSTSTEASTLAPEEVYDARRGEGGGGGGGGVAPAALLGSRDEMAPEEKQRLQRQLRRRKRTRNARIDAARRARDAGAAAAAGRRTKVAAGATSTGGGRRGSGATDEKEEALKKLMGNKGVSVIGKGSGKKKAGASAAHSGAPSAMNSAALKL